MLVISRRLNETVYIGDDITISVTKIDRNAVRISISAPREVPIFRGELLDEVERLKKTFQIPAKPPGRSARPS